MPNHPSRRAALGTIAGGLLAPGPATAEATCRLTPQAVEGPFYLDPRLVRADIREDCPGLPLLLRLRVATVPDCAPVAAARIDVWHADAQGRYSGYRDQGDRAASTLGQTFLRGTQFADAAGWATFRTVYPGWYPGRATHVHVKVILAARTVLTGQVYFPDAVNEAVQGGMPAYGGRARRGRITNDRDGLLRQDDPQRRGVAAVSATPEGYEAVLTLGVPS
ncbi:hypothetical protein OPKNFCMD_0109 [Methylobacterium crusticola]|uniref:Intradiol ring-cleavage dioxygenases domain-containing protein n=1 Tax=Methylobacterium crusticola TaxID=1697972 RepID=A0ABQ4QQ32_9HYPH|nr:intradiol ring-cleavage dioxygenase [Methylobacterium crusticola]GJD47403.1 hypothetical protein OPKNFCMD_0109 [Methylobacterium crusticola]